MGKGARKRDRRRKEIDKKPKREKERSHGRGGRICITFLCSLPVVRWGRGNVQITVRVLGALHDQYYKLYFAKYCIFNKLMMDVVDAKFDMIMNSGLMII